MFYPAIIRRRLLFVLFSKYTIYIKKLNVERFTRVILSWMTSARWASERLRRKRYGFNTSSIYLLDLQIFVLCLGVVVPWYYFLIPTGILSAKTMYATDGYLFLKNLYLQRVILNLSLIFYRDIKESCFQYKSSTLTYIYYNVNAAVLMMKQKIMLQ